MAIGNDKVVATYIMSPQQESEGLSEPLLRSDSLSDSQSILESESEDLPPTHSRREQHDQSPNNVVSRNVYLTLVYTAFAFAGRSIWNQSVLAAYVYLLEDDLEAVGYITAVMGISQLASSFPSGWIADKYRRDSLLKIASVAGMIAIGITFYALYSLNFKHLVMALAAWGCCWGIANTSLSALFADSIPTGKRSFYFTRRSMVLTSSFTTGPIVSLTMFALLGDQWKVKDCAIVMAAGQVICFPAMVLLCFFNDDFAVDHGEGNTTTQAVESSGHTSALPDSPQEEDCEDPNTDANNEQSTASLIESGEQPSVSWLTESRKIALLIASADLMAGLSSGMSIRYFPIFFKDNLHLGPVMVQVLYIAAPMCQTCSMRLAQWFSTKYGRCHVSACFKWLGISLMFAMIFSYEAGLPTWFVCTLYVFRTACANSTSALTRSVLMDNVPKSERGKWSALESLNMFSWSGSAALGGLLVGKVGMLHLFATTATLQFCATIPLMILFGRDTAEAPEDVVPTNNLIRPDPPAEERERGEEEEGSRERETNPQR